MTGRPAGFRDRGGVFLLYVVLLLAAYSPIVFQKFVFNDDNLMLLRPPESSGTAHPQFPYFFVIGRPLFSLLAWPVWSLVHSLAALSVVRFAMVILLAVSGVALRDWFRRAEAPPLMALLLPPALLLLPAVQMQMILANSFPHPLCLLLSIAGAFHALKWAETGARGDFGKSLGLIFLSLCIYPPTTFAYAALVFARLLFKRDPREAALLLVPLLSAAVLYFVFSSLSYKLLQPILNVPEYILGDHVVAASLAVKDKAALLLRLMLQSANLWGIRLDWPLALFTFYVLLGGSLAAVVRDRPGLGRLGLQAVLAAACLGISVLPQMAAASNIYSFRSLTGLSWIMLIAVAWSLTRLVDLSGKRLAPWLAGVVLAGLLLTCGVRCFAHLNRHIVYPARREMAFIEEKLRAAPPDQTELYFVCARSRNYLGSEYGYRNLLATDEYGYLSTTEPKNSIGMIRCVAEEAKIIRPLRGGHVVPDRSVVPDGALLININDLVPEL